MDFFFIIFHSGSVSSIVRISTVFILKWYALDFNLIEFRFDWCKKWIKNEFSQWLSEAFYRYMVCKLTITEWIRFLFCLIYLVSTRKCVTGAFLGSCEWAHDKFIERDVKLVINGRSGASGTSENGMNYII